MSLFSTFKAEEEKQRKEQEKFNKFMKEKVNEYMEQGMSVEEAMKTAFKNEYVLKLAKETGNEIAKPVEDVHQYNFKQHEMNYKNFGYDEMKDNDSKTVTRIFNAEIHWAQPIDVYITRPEAGDPNFVGKIYSNKDATFVDSFDDDGQELDVQQIYQSSVERITLCQGSMDKPYPLCQCFDEVCNVEDFFGMSEENKRKFLTSIYHQAWLELKSNLERMIYDRGLNPEKYLDSIVELFDHNQFPSTIELKEVVITSSLYDGSTWYPTNRKLVYNPITDMFAGDVTE